MSKSLFLTNIDDSTPLPDKMAALPNKISFSFAIVIREGMPCKLNN